ncbi:DGLA lipase, partial [Nyctibius bracteatus]|nr:DGLA lipase [Nyctibius bracteatus]
MPGIVVFRRRWSVGSDDLVLPAVFLFLLHTTWFVILSVVLFGLVYNPNETCSLNLVDHGRGYLGILLSCMIAEVAIIWLSMRGSILYTEPRDSMQYVLYVRLAILVIEFVYAIVGIVWLTQYYASCNDLTAKSVTLGTYVGFFFCAFLVCITVLCVFDPTGRTFVKLRATKRRQRNLRTYNLRYNLPEKSWELSRTLQQSKKKNQKNDAYSEIAYLFAEFFRDLDIVPSDIIAGLVLLRQRQRAKRNAVLDEANNDILAFLSGMPVTRNTKYLDLKNAQEMQRYKEVCYYMLFALAAYGWPIYLMRKPTCGLCRLARSCSCCCLCPSRPRYAPGVTIEEDNCCGCNAIAIRRHFLDENMTSVDIVYTSCHDAVYETPFYVAVDHDKKKVVISIRGTLSPKDALTDLTGDAERLPVEGHHGTWLGHKGMVLSAEYIKKKLEQEMVLSQAFGRDLGRGTKHYGLIVVGHSLGAGTAAILSFLLRPQYPSLKCFAYSPPGGLLSEDAMEYSKEFVTAVVLGKDLVPRQVGKIGLSQLEGFRRQLLDVLQRSNKPKWRIIVGATKCIPKSELPEETEENSVTSNRLWTHPSDLTIALSASTPLYPPGRIIHVVHNHPAEQCCCCEQEDPTYFAIWGDNKAFNEVIISPAMLHEHLPYVVMEGLNKVLENYNKGKTALLSAAKVMVSPTEVDLTPELIFQSQPLPSGPSVQIGTGAITVDRRNSSTKNLHFIGQICSQNREDEKRKMVCSQGQQMGVVSGKRRHRCGWERIISLQGKHFCGDFRESEGELRNRTTAVMEQQEQGSAHVYPAIPEENPSLSSRTELLAADSLSKHSQETQPPDNVLNSGGTTPQRRCSEEGASSEGDRGSLAPRDELSLQNGRLTDVPSPQVLEFAEFIDSLFNLDSKSSSFQDIYCMMVSDSSSDFAEMPKSVSDQEILLRAQYEPNLVPKPPRLFAGSTDPSSGISVSPSFPLSSSGELMDITPTGVSSQECLATDKIRTSTPTGHVTSPAKQDDLMISAL